jgi:uncharacterized metal-binding protein YceD (DUF177 family)
MEEKPTTAWSVPVTVAEIPESGGHYELSADAEMRAAVATMAGLRDLPRLDAVFDLHRLGDAVKVRGEVSARVGQTCVVTLEPIENDVHETVDLIFAPPSDPVVEDDDEPRKRRGKGEPPEPLEEGVLDLGAIATEFLVLGIDPYPRKPGAEFDQPKDRLEEQAHPFAALAALKKQP